MPIQMDTNMAAGNQQKHLSLSFELGGLFRFSLQYTLDHGVFLFREDKVL